jgi:glycosyltransferase involved in cell wall biosynthesis
MELRSLLDGNGQSASCWSPMDKCRILYVARPSAGGVAVILYRLIKALDSSRYTPKVVFYTQGNSHIADKLAELGVEVLTLSPQEPVAPKPVKPRDNAKWLEKHCGRWAAEIYAFFKFYYQFMRRDMPKALRIARVIKEKQIDLVHLSTHISYERAGAIAAKIGRVPCVSNVSMLNHLNHFDRMLARFIDRFIFVSNATAQNYIAQGVPSDRGTVIHNAVDLEVFPSACDGAAVREEFGLAADDFVVGNVGRLDWWKGHDFFLKAMAEVAQVVPNLKCLIVGQREPSALNQAYFENLQFLTESLGLSDKVVFTGFRSDVPRILSALDVMVHSSSLPEPFGIVIIEGMAAGRPVVATKAGGVLDIIEDGISGLLVPCKDSKAMAEAVLQLFSDREKARQMSLAARRRVEEKFTVEHHVARVQSLYDSLRDGCGRSPGP